VINEVDYDQPSPPTNDSASFVEVRNAGSAPASLVGVKLVYVNGNSATRAQYGQADLSSLVTLAPGEVLVVGNAPITDALPATVKKLTVNGDFLQNGGAPEGDAIALMAGCTRLDSLSYEGTVRAATITGCSPPTFDLTEGTGNVDLLEDRVTANIQGSLVRVGPDTDSTADDWIFQSPPTPGL